MTKPAYELAGIIAEYGNAYIEKHLPHPRVLQTLRALELCRTQALGGHVDVCDACSHTRISYNSCRNRHCPKCQTTNRQRWILARKQDLLEVPYFHVVFTLPEQLNPYCFNYPAKLYNMLFAASKETIELFGRDEKHLGAKTGMISVLHTWGQNLSLHPHVHMIVPGGGITQAGNWKNARSKGTFLFPVKALSVVFRAKFMEKLLRFLTEKNVQIEKPLRHLLYQKDWVVYAKRPFLGPQQVIEYLGRYSHKIAISNHRLLGVQDGKVRFRYKDYRSGGTQKTMELHATEFLRRFCLHILPPGYRKIRHYGFLASRNKPLLRKQQQAQNLTQPKSATDWKTIAKECLNFDVEACPCCKTGKMIRILTFDANAPPDFSLSKQGQIQVSKAKPALA